jgi:flagellar biogenesis protein FliO
MGAPQCWADPSQAEKLADEIAVTELPAGTVTPQTAGLPAAKPQKDAPAAARLSIVDVAGKTAALMLLVYALAWGVKQAQRGRLHLGLPRSDATDSPRLKHCANLALRNGASLHIVEMDGRSVLVATQGNGEVRLLIGGAAPAIVPQAANAAAPAAVEVGLDDNGREEDWEQRRDVLIRALAQRAAAS